jgi:cytochrome c553
MKQLTIPAFVLAVVTVAFSQFIPASKTTTASFGPEIHAQEIPEDVMAVIDKSCFGCHSEKGKSDDAKDALRWDKMAEYDKAKLVSVLDEIIKTNEKEEIPQEKYLEKKTEIKPRKEK